MASLLHKFRTAQRDVVFVRADYTTEKSKLLPEFLALHGDTKQIPDKRLAQQQEPEWEPFAIPLPNEVVIEKSNWNVTTDRKNRHQNIQRWRSMGIDTVVMCGLITSACVQHSAYGLFEQGFKIVVISDACADRGRERHENCLKLYAGYMYRTKTVDEIG